VLIPVDALDVPPLGVINTHPSLLPRYRGPNPIAWTVRNGDRELGYSIHRMDADFDTACCSPRHCEIEPSRPARARVRGLSAPAVARIAHDWAGGGAD
jgi:methionyl-tRNA formyltransferase